MPRFKLRTTRATRRMLITLGYLCGNGIYWVRINTKAAYASFSDGCWSPSTGKCDAGRNRSSMRLRLNHGHQFTSSCHIAYVESVNLLWRNADGVHHNNLFIVCAFTFKKKIWNGWVNIQEIYILLIAGMWCSSSNWLLDKFTAIWVRRAP